MKHVLGGILFAALASMPAFAEEAEFAPNLALLQNAASLTSIRTERVSPEHDTALIKEGESDSAETVAAIERNREDRERSVVMDR